MNDSSQSISENSSQVKCSYSTRIIIIISVSIVLIIVLYTIIQFLYIRYKKWKKRNHLNDINHTLKDIEAQDAHISTFELLKERISKSSPSISNESVNLFDMLQSNSSFISLKSSKQSDNGMLNSIRIKNLTIPDIRFRRSSLALSLKIKTILNELTIEQHQIQSKAMKSNNIYPDTNLLQPEIKDIQISQDITQLSLKPLKRSHSTSLLSQSSNGGSPYL